MASNWELSKENIVPMKRGRNPDAMKDALASGTDLASKKMEFEKKLRSYSGDDPLSVWIEYIRWVEEYYLTENASMMKSLIQKCVTKFKTNPRYHNDSRWLYVWFKMAQASANLGSLTIYEYMNTENYCTKLAAFYIQWSWELEVQGDCSKANDVLKMGITADAQPMPRLQEALQSFDERSLAREMERTSEDCSLEDEPAETRCFLGALKAVGPKKMTPFDRHSQQTPVTVPSGNGKKMAGRENFMVFNEADLLKPNSFGNFRHEAPGKRYHQPSSTSSSSSAHKPLPDNKENYTQPSQWTRQKLGSSKHQGSAPSLPGAPKEFDVLNEDEYKEKRKVKSVSSSALKTKDEKFDHPLVGLTNPDSLGDRNQKVKLMYDEGKVNEGQVEMSFEEIRAMRREYGLRTEDKRHPSVVASYVSTPSPPISSGCEQSTSHLPNQKSLVNTENENYGSDGRGGKRKGLSARGKMMDERGAEAAPVLPVITRTTSSPMENNEAGGKSTKSSTTITDHAAKKSVALRPKLAAEPSPCNSPASKHPKVLTSASNHGSGHNLLGNGSSHHNNYNTSYQPGGNTSFTVHLKKEALAVFGDTLQFSDHEHSSGSTNSHQQRPSSVTPTPQPIVAPPAGLEFQIYSDRPAVAAVKDGKSGVGEGNQPVPQPKRKPFADLSAPSSVPPPVSEPMKDEFQVFNENDFKAPLKPVVPKQSVSKQPSIDDIPAIPMSNDFGGFYDPNEPTLANFGFKQAYDRASSTPCALGAIVKPSFSEVKPWENQGSGGNAGQLPGTNKRSDNNVFGVELDENEYENDHINIGGGEPEEEEHHKTPLQNRIWNNENAPAEHPMSEQTGYQLYTIDEASRETFKSGGSSLASSASSNGVNGGSEARKHPLRTTVTTTPMQPIKELSFGGCTTSATTPGVPSTTRTRADSGHFKTPVTPQITEPKMSANDAEMENAVRRLSLNTNNNIGGDLQPSTFNEINKSLDVEQHEMTCTDFKRDIVSGIDPWSSDLINQILDKFGDPRSADNYHLTNQVMPAIRIGQRLKIGSDHFKVEKLLGEGAFARAYLVSIDSKQKQSVIKVQKPGCPWEFHICRQLQNTITDPNVVNGIMKIDDAYQFNDGSLFLNQYHPYGTLLNVVNKVREETKKIQGVGELVAVYFTIEMISILTAIHDKANIIHADVKPDNFLLIDLPKEDDDIEEQIENGSVRSCKLIDWGRSIDMGALSKLYPDMAAASDGITFTGKAQTDGFECIEMIEGKPWTKQTDYFGLLGTCYTLLFGDYMKVYKPNKSSQGPYKTTGNFKRIWTPLWKEFFDKLLNVDSCSKQPDLKYYQEEFKVYLTDTIALQSDTWTDQLVTLRKAIKMD